MSRKRDLALIEIEYSGWLRTVITEKLALAVVANALGRTIANQADGTLSLCRSQFTSPAEQDKQNEER